MKKIVLAYSGGLDTSVILRWLQENYRAEVIAYNDYLDHGSELAVKEAGKLSIEGKEYIVQDGDVMHFRFNV